MTKKYKLTKAILGIGLCLLGGLMWGCKGSDSAKAEDFEGDDPGECSDEADNDRDGLFDCEDPDCEGSPDCDGDAESDDSEKDKTQGSELEKQDTSEPEIKDTEPEIKDTEPEIRDTEPETKDTEVDEPDTDKDPVVIETDWLHTEGNKILHENGTPFHGRGANIHDTRSCWACAYSEPNVAEVNRRIDALVDDWGANFMRLALENYEKDEWMVQGDGPLEDPAYMEDIIEIVEHIGSKPGTYVLVSLWVDKNTDDMGWPTAGTYEVWEGLSEKLLQYPHVMFGIVNEPESNNNGNQDADVWERMNTAVETIRAVEAANGSPKHLIAVQGTRAWARNLEYYVDHPITADNGENVVYETHSYNHADEFEEIWMGPSETLPVIIGEFGPTDYMTMEETSLMMDEAEKRDVPWLAWTFHQRCDPNLIVDHEGSGCGADMEITPTDWGQIIKDRLAVPW